MNLKRTSITTGSLLVLVALFIALIVISNTALRGLRLDLTENNLYTLSEGTKHIVQGLDEPINLYFFFSEQTSQEFPPLRTYAQRVREVLEEFSLYADGQLQLHFVDPQPFSEEEDRAAGFGLQAVPVGAAGESIYFGLAGTNTVDGVEAIPFFQPDKEAFLEYDISKLIYSLAHPKKPVIGILSTLPMTAGFDPMTRQMRQAWVVIEQLQQLFEVRTLDPGIERIEPDIDVLLIVHPKNVADATLYAIDQFVLGGGRAMVFVDPLSEIDTSAQDPSNPAAAMFADRSSNLASLFAAWGVNYDPTQVIADGRYALAVSTQPGQYPVQHLGILGVDRSAFPPDEVITAELSSVNLALTGFLSATNGSETSLSPLISSSTQAMPMAVDAVKFLPDPGALQQGFSPTGQSYTLAARVRGTIKSAFPDGPPGTQDQQIAAENSKHLSESTAPVDLIVVADTDLLADRLWVQVQNFFGQRLASAFANNGDFVVNGLDNLTGNSDLIGIRGQAVGTRPFTTVQALEREANAKFLATEQQLEAELNETEQRLAELQRSREDEQSLILSDEQRAELDRFQQRRLEIRKELRQVRRDLDKNIEQLGTTLKIINIGLMPLLLSLAGLAAWWLRNKKRQAAQKEALI